MILIRSLVFQVAFYTSLIILMIAGLPATVLSRASVSMVVQFWAKLSLWLLATICGTRVEFRGLQYLPKGAAIIAPKHQSFLETFALITVLPNFTYILKKELVSIPFFGLWLKATEQIAIDRSKRGGTLTQLQKDVRAKLDAGRQVIIFPEGTRTPVGAKPNYKTGVAVLCDDCTVPCTPVALNAGLFWPRRSILRPPGTVVIEFLPPLMPNPDKRLFIDALEAAIEPASNALVKEALAANPNGFAFKAGPATA